MPPHWPYNHTINLDNDQALPHSHIYPLLGTELGILREFLDDMLEKGLFMRLAPQVMHRSYSPRRKMAPFGFVLTFGTSTKLPERIGTLYHWSRTLLTNLEQPKSTPNSTCVPVTTTFALPPATSGRQHFGLAMAPSNSWSCRWDLPMPQQLFNTL